MSVTAISFGIAFLAAAVGAVVVVATREASAVLQKLRGAWRERLYPALVFTHAELRRLPESDEERLRALELALCGIATCIFGILFPLLLPVGAIIFYYGARKVGAALLHIRTKE